MEQDWPVSQHGCLEEIVKLGLNVGSGQRPFKSVFDQVQWVNVDAVDSWKPDLVCDGSALPYADESVDYVVLHHVLEHFGCGEGVGLLREAHRVLKVDGILQIFVPNIRALAIGWLEGKIGTQIFLTNVYGAYMGHEEDRHKWNFDTVSLWQFVSQLRWQSVTEKCQNIPGSDCAHDWWILEMELLK